MHIAKRHPCCRADGKKLQFTWTNRRSCFAPFALQNVWRKYEAATLISPGKQAAMAYNVSAVDRDKGITYWGKKVNNCQLNNAAL